MSKENAMAKMVPTAPADVEALLDANSDLVDRFAAGDEHALASLVEATLGVEVVTFDKVR